MSIIIGLTGGIASGKTTVSNMFIEKNIPVIDTDKIAKELLSIDTEAYNEIIEMCGDDIKLSNNEINRKKLATIIFSNEEIRNRLNLIVHPRVKKIMMSEVARYKQMEVKIIVIDVPLLFESGFDKYVDETITVFVNFENQLDRLMSRDQIDLEYANLKIKSQLPLSEKVKRSTYVIDNSLSILETKKQFLEVLEKVESKF
ncbi:dephospho-CoA kinase [Candidatus Izimaplasma bacterium ZiA1]|uniref:dephospho-CoA kinase n=1 Tax=Candidatus Izimoplasma sp. ZiA1 TaxID=2024899 RepID=UPI000BAA3DE3|nr:dephospho-CoA kinase [Candidatus Izimaplasma bacterium ZiA1]